MSKYLFLLIYHYFIISQLILIRKKMLKSNLLFQFFNVKINALNREREKKVLLFNKLVN